MARESAKLEYLISGETGGRFPLQKQGTNARESSQSESMSHGTFDDAPSSSANNNKNNNSSGFGSGMNIFGANSVRERPQSVSSFQDINASSTLDESISKTFKRDIDRIVSNVKNVLVALELFLVVLAGFVIYRRGACTMYVVDFMRFLLSHPDVALFADLKAGFRGCSSVGCFLRDIHRC